MATRVLPGVYTSLNDLSQIPEGPTSLIVGYVLAADKGPVNEPTFVTSPTDFLAKFSYLGKPGIGADPTYWDILKVLPQTNQMYVIRAANNPRYGTLKIVKEEIFGDLIQCDISDNEYAFLVENNFSIPEGERIQIKGNTGYRNHGYYDVIRTEEDGENTRVICRLYSHLDPNARGTFQYRYDVTAITDSVVIIPSPEPYGEDEEIHVYTITVRGDATRNFNEDSELEVTRCSVEENNKRYHVRAIEYNKETDETIFTVDEEVLDANDGVIWSSLVQMSVAPQQDSGGMNMDEKIQFNPNDSFLVRGKDPGSYNNDIGIEIVSSVDDPDQFVYHRDADLGDTICTFDTIQLRVYANSTNELLETFLFSKDINAKTIDGQSLYIDDVVKGSNYISVINNEGTQELPGTGVGRVSLMGGDNGPHASESTVVAALEAYMDKTVPVSILACGSSHEQESPVFQQALLEIATTRKDLVIFLNSRRDDENYVLPSERVKNMVNYKKGELGAVTFYGTMYAPHVNSTDTVNQRQVKLGAASTAVAGWLNVINSLSYPYAYAGPQNGQVLGVTCDWKIGDTSGEAELLNNASINYVAYDAKVGRYYMQCQNTLQVANSALRNLGAVLNILDIKEHFQTSLKEYLQLPITDRLRRDIVNTAKDYLDPMAGIRFYNYTFQDVSTDLDIADNTLRYLLTLNPTAYAQKIYLVMNIVNANFDFAILQSM